MKAQYGIDAPGLVRLFFAIAFGLIAVAVLLIWLSLPNAVWANRLAVVLASPALYSLGMGCLMVFESLYTKLSTKERLLDLVAWTGAEQVLDVGCGRGMFLVAAAKRLTSGTATGIDIWRSEDQSANNSAGALENARREGVLDRVAVETADMRKLPFPDGSFDLITSGWAVHNLDALSDRAQALSEMVRVLRSGGTIILSDIVNRTEYYDAFVRLGLRDVKIIVDQPLRDWILRTVSFGSYQPAAVIAHAAN